MRTWRYTGPGGPGGACSGGAGGPIVGGAGGPIEGGGGLDGEASLMDVADIGAMLEVANVVEIL